MDFKEFCEKISANLGLQFCPYIKDDRHGTTMRATKENPNPKFWVDFSNLSFGHLHFVAEVFDTERKLYVGTIGFENYEGKNEFEHYETQVSPDGRYNSGFMPINENGEEIDGQLWRFYLGKSLKRACNSFLKGGALMNPKRKPIKVW